MRGQFMNGLHPIRSNIIWKVFYKLAALFILMVMDGFSRFLKTLLDSIYWFFGNAVFSIFPLLIIYYIKSLGANDSLLNDQIYNLLKGGIVIFFFCSLMGSIAIDLIIAGSLDCLNRNRKLLYKFVLIQVPFIILFSLVIMYLLVVFKYLKNDFLMLNSPYILFVLIFSGLYCFVFKFYNFGKEENLWNQ